MNKLINKQRNRGTNEITNKQRYNQTNWQMRIQKRLANFNCFENGILEKYFCHHKILQVHWLKWLGICCCYGHTLGLRGSINSGWGQFRSFWWQRGRLLRSRRECLDFTTILSSFYAQLPSIWLMLYVRYSTQWTRLLNLEIGWGIWLL